MEGQARYQHPLPCPLVHLLQLLLVCLAPPHHVAGYINVWECYAAPQARQGDAHVTVHVVWLVWLSGEEGLDGGLPAGPQAAHGKGKLCGQVVVLSVG